MNITFTPIPRNVAITPNVSVTTAHTFSIRNQHCPKGCAARVWVNSKKRQRLQCALCKITWAIYKTRGYGFLLHGNERLIQAKQFLDQGFSIRSTAKSLGVSPSTIQRWKVILNHTRC